MALPIICALKWQLPSQIKACELLGLLDMSSPTRDSSMICNLGVLALDRT